MENSNKNAQSTEKTVNVSFTQNELHVLLAALTTTLMEASVRLQDPKSNILDKMSSAVVGKGALEMLKKIEPLLEVSAEENDEDGTNQVLSMLSDLLGSERKN